MENIKEVVFKLILNVMYKVQKGKPFTISNAKMTNDLAIQFLKVKSSRIELFSDYPENWKELIGESTDVEPVIEPKPKPKRKYTRKKPCTNCKKKATNNKKK